jgi:hypothetical protein
MIPSWIFFFVGQLLHMWVKASGIVHNKTSGLNTYFFGPTAYARHYAPILVSRLFASGCLFLLWMGGVDLGFIPARAQFSSPWLAAGVAGFIGLGIDRLLEEAAQKWSWLKDQIPPEPKGDTVVLTKEEFEKLIPKPPAQP